MSPGPWLAARLTGHRHWWGNATLLTLDALALAIAHETGDRGAWLAALGLVAASGLASFAGNLRRHRLIADVPTSRVASAPQGYVELCGQAEQFDGHLLLSPLGHRPCVWYRYQVETRRASSDWRVREFGASDDTFLLRDDSGQCIIDPDGAEITTTHKRVWTEGDERYTEWLLLPADPLYAIGHFSTLAPGASPGGLREEVGALLAEWKRNPAQLKQRFDANRDGEIDLTEWEGVRAAAVQEIETRERERASAPPVHLLRKPRDGRPYLLSNLPPERLAARYRRWAVAHLAVFVAAAAGLARFL